MFSLCLVILLLYKIASTVPLTYTSHSKTQLQFVLLNHETILISSISFMKTLSSHLSFIPLLLFMKSFQSIIKKKLHLILLILIQTFSNPIRCPPPFTHPPNLLCSIIFFSFVFDKNIFRDILNCREVDARIPLYLML